MGCKNCEVDILIVDDEEITRLNRQYFHRTRPTNVISFPMRENPGAINPQILGDVIISAETAERQALAAGGTAAEEILFLMVHGILHLLGYDHEGLKDERRKMEAREKELFALLMNPLKKQGPRLRRDRKA